MIIKKIKLKNIRSYTDEEIVFPTGTVLLSGDIGSGKSTILLAIDFALFGIRRGELSGSALLRNGLPEGYVILNFSIGDKDIFIKRTLKRSSNGIVQDSGYLTINDVTQEFTPVELKHRILQLLSYPPEMLTKKSLIYRYTVYTPQEEMKLILLGEKEDRLETLRKVFNIDKYKRIKENSKIVASEIKQKKKEFVGIIADLEGKKLKLMEKDIENKKLKENIIIHKERLGIVNVLLKDKKQSLSNFEQQVEKLRTLKKDLEIIQHNLKTREELKLRNINQIKLIEKRILELEDETKIEINFEELKKSITVNENSLEEVENELSKLINGMAAAGSKKRSSNEIIAKITSINFCPLCNQNVSEQHKNDVIKKEKDAIQNLERDLLIFISKENDLKNKLKEIKEILKEMKNKEKSYEIANIKLSESKNKRETIDSIRKEQEDIESLVKNILEKKQLIERELIELKDVDSNYLHSKKELDELTEQQKMIEISIAELNKESESIVKEMDYIKEEITKKEKAKVKLDDYIKLQDWLENFFVGIVDLIEKKVMLRVHSDFNSLFQKWFDILMDNDIIKVRLDEEFTPLIEQNSHDIEYENLSGGEKTACALAYRLALNQVINNIVSMINTKDLIILDEPTDGFSSEQLDKIKPVLEELKMKQIIIVSHESKIETFVDSIIRIQKQGHASQVML